MNWLTYYCPKCDSILVGKCEKDLTYHCGVDQELHMLIFCQRIGEYPADWTRWEVKAQARYQVENFGLVGGVVAHG